MMATTSSPRVADNVLACLHGFRSLCDVPHKWESSLQKDTSQEDITDQVFLMKLKDEQSRFVVWSGNIGAHRNGRSSLDHRLRDASNIRDQIIQILRNLIELFGDTKEILEGNTAPSNREQLSLDILDDVSDDGSLPLVGLSLPSELSQILSSIVESINCLFRLSVSIHNPFPHDRLKKASSTDASHFEPFDIDHVRTKFATASDAITERLGKANSRRRQYFKYRELHHQKLATGLEDNKDYIAESTEASSLPPGLSSGELVQSGLREPETCSAVSETSYATSGTNPGQRKVPALPAEAQHGPFECPFCFMMISASSKRLWKKHVFSDLCPYICVELECSAPDQDFQQRHQWVDHVRKYHWRTWACHLGCDITFTCLKGITTHLTQVHFAASTLANFKSLLSICERPKHADDSAECPLCEETLASFKQYQRHVGRHQEELALFTLPQYSKDDGESNDKFEDGRQKEAKGREIGGSKKSGAQGRPFVSPGQFIPADWRSPTDESSTDTEVMESTQDLVAERDDPEGNLWIERVTEGVWQPQTRGLSPERSGSKLTRSELYDLYY